MRLILMRKLLAFICISGFFSVHTAFLEGQAGFNPLPGASVTQNPFDEVFSDMDRAFVETASEPTLVDLYFLGRAVAAHILTIYKPYTGNPELTLYLNLICQALLVHAPEMELFAGAQVLILDSPELNAFASPGGHIFITRGLVGAVDSEDMLAAIIAHELAHVKLKHGAGLIAEMRFSDDMAAIADRAFEFSRDLPMAQRLGGFRDSVTVVIDTLMINGYSQIQEFEADQEALILLALSGYNPRALVQVLEILQRTQDSGNVEINTTHPSPVQRIAYIESLFRGRQFRDTGSYRMHRFRN